MSSVDTGNTMDPPIAPDRITESALEYAYWLLYYREAPEADKEAIFAIIARLREELGPIDKHRWMISKKRKIAAQKELLMRKEESCDASPNS